jgi:hypothetical protein
VRRPAASGAEWKHARVDGRQARAQLRRGRSPACPALGLRHGTEAVIAHRLGVSEATMSRDVTAVFGYRPRRCPCCGYGCDALADLDGTP